LTGEDKFRKEKGKRERSYEEGKQEPAVGKKNPSYIEEKMGAVYGKKGQIKGREGEIGRLKRDNIRINTPRDSDKEGERE